MRRALWLPFIVALSASPAQAYVDISPSLGQVIKDASAIAVLRVDKVSQEKRAILSSWASDACAVESIPALRKPPGATRPVGFDAIMDALRSLDNPRRYVVCSRGSRANREAVSRLDA